VRYNVIAANLHTDGVTEADRIAGILREEGWPRATRSLVIREALDLLSEHLANKDPDHVFRYFIDRLGRRASGPQSS
jgi:hypothetical protein